MSKTEFKKGLQEYGVSGKAVEIDREKGEVVIDIEDKDKQKLKGLRTLELVKIVGLGVIDF